MRSLRRLRAAAAFAALPVLGGCGKKGPPLPPIVRIPTSVEKIEARRVGADVYVTLTIPSANVDETAPADVARVEVFGYTGRVAPSRPRFAEVGLVVASVPVEPSPGTAAAQRAASQDTAPAGPPQGGVITIRDVLTPDELVQGKEVMQRARGVPVAAASEKAPGSLRRFYMAFGFSARGRPGPPGAIAELPLDPLPPPPESVTASYDEVRVLVRWEPSGGILGFLLDRTLPPEPPPTGEEEELSVPAAAPPAPIGYNVYLALAPDPLALPDSGDVVEPWNARPPRPIHGAAVTTLSMSDSVEFGRERCYTVRAVRGAGSNMVEGEPSLATCLTPIDTFPPARPRALAAVASEHGISLIWEPNTEPDLAGYLVLRAEAPDATLHPLTTTPLTEARYTDSVVRPGVRYVYAVIAIDNRLPLPNMSEPSQSVEESAR